MREGNCIGIFNCEILQIEKQMIRGVRLGPVMLTIRDAELLRCWDAATNILRSWHVVTLACTLQSRLFLHNSCYWRAILKGWYYRWISSWMNEWMNICSQVYIQLICFILGKQTQKKCCTSVVLFTVTCILHICITLLQISTNASLTYIFITAYSRCITGT